MAALMRCYVYRQCIAGNLKSRHICIYSKYIVDNSRQCTSKHVLTTTYKTALFAKTNILPSMSLLLARCQTTGGLLDEKSSIKPVSFTNDTVDVTPVSSYNDLHNLPNEGVGREELYTSFLTKNNELQNPVPSAFDIPEPPAPQTVIDTSEFASGLLETIEPSLTSYGLGGWTPIGLLQHLLDWLHVSVGLPWWGSIVVATIIGRTVMFPLFVKGQQNAAIMTNNMPQMQALQLKVTEAQMSGNAMEAARFSNDLAVFMKEKGCNPIKSMLVPLAQAPIFLSFFIGLRRMANLPIESFKDGGIFWFTDLTIADPYFLLPIITSATLFITIEVGAETGVQANQLQLVRYFMRAIPLIMLPFIMNFPAAILCYWVATNGVTLLLVGLIKMPKVRQFFKIPIKIPFDPNNLPMKRKGFVESIKETMQNSKITREMEDRSRIDAIKFRKAGMGPVPKTYAYDPTKQRKE